MEDRQIRAALDRHWAASDANDFEAEHQIYREDAVLEYPQSGERIRGRRVTVDENPRVIAGEWGRSWFWQQKGA